MAAPTSPEKKDTQGQKPSPHPENCMISPEILQTVPHKLEETEKSQNFLQNFRFPLAFLQKMWYNIRQMCQGSPEPADFDACEV